MAGRRPPSTLSGDGRNIRVSSPFACCTRRHAGAAVASAFYLPARNTVRVKVLTPKPEAWQTKQKRIGHNPQAAGAKGRSIKMPSLEARAEGCQTGTDIPPHLAFNQHHFNRRKVHQQILQKLARPRLPVTRTPPWPFQG